MITNHKEIYDFWFPSAVDLLLIYLVEVSPDKESGFWVGLSQCLKISLTLQSVCQSLFQVFAMFACLKLRHWCMQTLPQPQGVWLLAPLPLGFATFFCPQIINWGLPNVRRWQEAIIQLTNRDCQQGGGEKGWSSVRRKHFRLCQIIVLASSELSLARDQEGLRKLATL